MDSNTSPGIKPSFNKHGGNTGKRTINTDIMHINSDIRHIVSSFEKVKPNPANQTIISDIIKQTGEEYMKKLCINANFFKVSKQVVAEELFDRLDQLNSHTSVFSNRSELYETFFKLAMLSKDKEFVKECFKLPEKKNDIDGIKVREGEEIKKWSQWYGY